MSVVQTVQWVYDWKFLAAFRVTDAKSNVSEKCLGTNMSDCFQRYSLAAFGDAEAWIAEVR
jgi:hypothetical protein